MDTFSPAQWDNARDYLFTHGRALDQARFTFHFEGGARDAVLEALAVYQNEDGGFGHAIEPDLRTPASSVIGTSTAFHILRAIDAPPDHPLVKRGVDYLIAQFNESERVWPIVPPAVEDAPHAPWWFFENADSAFNGFIHNPRAEVLGHLYHFDCPINGGFLALVIDGLRGLPEKVDLYDLRSYLGLATARGLPGEKRAELEALLAARIPMSIATTPEAWAAHGQMLPLDAAPHPESFAARFIDTGLLKNQLDFEIASQSKDGSWMIGWEWADFGADAWAQAEKDWKGFFIVKKLKTIQAYGRL